MTVSKFPRSSTVWERQRRMFFHPQTSRPRRSRRTPLSSPSSTHFSKFNAVLGMESPTNTTELRQFLGMVNQLGKFSAHLAELSQPLRELLSHKKAWLWGPTQDTAFRAIKEELAKPTTLALYNVTAPTTVSADASSYGLGAVLLQKQPSGSWAPIAYASRAMTPTEQRYS